MVPAWMRVLTTLSSPIDKTTYVLACETKNNGQPRFVRSAIKTLRSYMYGREEILTPVLLAPYLSADSRQICQENNIAFLDMEGNAQLQFGGVYIDHRMPGKPVPENVGFVQCLARSQLKCCV